MRKWGEGCTRVESFNKGGVIRFSQKRRREKKESAGLCNCNAREGGATVKIGTMPPRSGRREEKHSGDAAKKRKQNGPGPCGEKNASLEGVYKRQGIAKSRRRSRSGRRKKAAIRREKRGWKGQSFCAKKVNDSRKSGPRKGHGWGGQKGFGRVLEYNK